MSYELERSVLKIFLEEVLAVNPPDNSISESKIVRQTKSKLKTALSDVPYRCSCAKCKYTICEVCQGSDEELVYLRVFYRGISNAKKSNMSPEEIQQFVTDTANRIETAGIKIKYLKNIEQTPKARAFWDMIPNDAKIKILNSVFCNNCVKAEGSVGIAIKSMKLEKGNLIINGNCTSCGKQVARVVEGV